MKVPKDDSLGTWCKELIEQCEVSRADRIAHLGTWRAFYWMGSDTYDAPAKYNKIYSHIDRLASFLFAADDVRFTISLDGYGEPWNERVAAASRTLTRNFHRCSCDLEFSDAVHWALIEGKTLIKQNWGHDGLEPWLIHPQFFGVLREDIDGLDRQEAFVHTSFITRSELERQISGMETGEANRIRKALDSSKAASADEVDPLTDTLRQIIIGGMRPVQQNVASTTKSSVALSTPPTPALDPKVMRDLVRVDELWVVDSERDDYTTIRLIDPGIVLEGNLRHRNLSGVTGEQPFIEVCPNRIDNYFWGQSEIATLAPLQEMLNKSLNDLSRITKLQSNPPRAGIGFSGMTEQKYKALNVPGGWISEESPNAKIETLAPEVPPELFQSIEKILNWFDEAGGFQPIMMGQGEPGVRAGSHAATLLRTGSPRIRDRSLLVERQCAAHADFCFKLLQEKDARVYVSKQKEQFLLKQMPDEYRVEVDSHSGSPIFQDDTEKKAFLLSKAGAISPTDLIMLTRPPHQDILIEHAEARAAAQAKLMQEHPELLTKGKGAKR